MRERPTPTDDVARARQGDPEAWRRLLVAHRGLLIHVCGSFGLAHHDIAEVSQNTWLKCFEHLDELREDAAFPGWLATIARRECLRQRRDQAGVEPVDPSSALWVERLDTRLDVAEEVIERHELRQLELAIQQLPRRQRRVIETLRNDAVSYQRAADQLGIPIGSLGPTRARAVARLREHPGLAPAS